MLISIIIPTYNRAHLIGETLDSIIAQTYKNWECIVVDDGSSDETDQVLKTYCEKDSRFKYFHRPKEHLSGGNGARNYGLKKSKGVYIQWFDSDDLMKIKYLESQITSIAKNSSDITICEFEIFNNTTIKKFELTNFNERNLLKDFILKKIKLCLPVLMFKRELVINIFFDENQRKAQDLDFIYDILTLFPNLKVSFNKIILCSFRLHNQRISADYKNFNKKMLLSSIKVKEKILLNEYDKLEQDEKDRLLTQYLSEIKSLLYTFDISHFLKKIKILRKNKIISFFYSLQIIISSFRISLNEMIWRYLKKIYRIIKKL